MRLCSLDVVSSPAGSEQSNRSGSVLAPESPPKRSVCSLLFMKLYMVVYNLFCGGFAKCQVASVTRRSIIAWSSICPKASLVIPQFFEMALRARLSWPANMEAKLTQNLKFLCETCVLLECKFAALALSVRGAALARVCEGMAVRVGFLGTNPNKKFPSTVASQNPQIWTWRVPHSSISSSVLAPTTWQLEPWVSNLVHSQATTATVPTSLTHFRYHEHMWTVT